MGPATQATDRAMELIRSTVAAGQCRAMLAILRTQAGQMVIDASRGSASLNARSAARAGRHP